jgi:hypothetical protein
MKIIVIDDTNVETKIELNDFYYNCLTELAKNSNLHIDEIVRHIIESYIKLDYNLHTKWTDYDKQSSRIVSEMENYLGVR